MRKLKIFTIETCRHSAIFYVLHARKNFQGAHKSSVKNCVRNEGPSVTCQSPNSCV